MDAKEVIVAGAVANAELMAERDDWRNKCAVLAGEVENLQARVAELESDAEERERDADRQAD